MEEIWKNINDVYICSNTGRIINTKNGREVKQSTNRKHNGYLRVWLGDKLAYVHRLVGELFVKIPKHLKGYNMDDLEINHIDFNTLNNNFTNLEWCTHTYNMKYRQKTMKSLTINGKKQFIKNIKKCV